MLLMAVMTNIVSNNVAAVIGTPIAISIAQELGLPLEPFVPPRCALLNPFTIDRHGVLTVALLNMGSIFPQDKTFRDHTKSTDG